MLKRFLIAAPLAAVVTGGLFLTMRMLMDVSVERPEPEKGTVVETGRRIGNSRSIPEAGPEWRPEKTVWCPIDSGVMPVSRSAPLYPACGKGDGEVTLEFTVKANGVIGHITVISATSSCFADAARFAPRRWRYRPRVVNGEPLSCDGVRARILFKEGHAMATVLTEPTTDQC